MVARVGDLIPGQPADELQMFQDLPVVIRIRIHALEITGDELIRRGLGRIKKDERVKVGSVH